MTETLAERRAEFEAHLWDHADDAFQKEFDFRRPLSKSEISALTLIAQAIAEGKDDEAIADVVKAQAALDSDVFLTIMQVVGLTRNKIITDLKASTAARGLTVPGRPALLPRSRVWHLAGPYVAERLRRVIEPLCSGDVVDESAFEALNQATYPGWIRQQRAKLSGHEAEYRLAVLLDQCGIPFSPEEKKDNPLCRDATVNEVSFDLVVPDAESPLVCVKATVHTANIGQFGESKDALEIIEAAAMIEERFASADRPTLLALIDGVGFRSNRAGLDGVLDSADEFCQFETLWKAAVVGASRTGVYLTVALPADDIDAHSNFLKRYEGTAEVDELTDDFRATITNHALIDAGEAIIRIT
jgi:hypothetical protein